MRLEKYVKEDKNLYKQLVCNEETMGMNMGRAFTEEEAELFFPVVLKQNTGEDAFGVYKVFADVNGREEYIGMGAFSRNEEYDAPEIEYMLLPQFWHKGYGTKLAELLMDMVKDSSRVAAITDPGNTYSRRILMKNGFVSVKRFQNEDGVPAELFLKGNM